ncbi:MAG: beta-lactamase family protein [Alphaproteobacteria bacterium]|nr:beta-lactamase family protein [Alphaproteobacteria bacterium]
MSGGAFSGARLARLHDALAAHVANGAMSGIVALVSRRGETHVETIGKQSFEAEAPMRRDTIFRIASMTKPITAAAALILVEECRLRLDDPVDDWLPELADRRVLKSLEGPVDDTVPAKRAIRVRDLLTFTFGLGLVMEWPPRHPIQKAMTELEVAPGPFQPELPADEFMKRLGSLPLIHQPGEGWLYHTGSDVLGVLIARASGQSLATFLRERLFEPLGMRDTGFTVPAEKLDRLASAYMGVPGGAPGKAERTFFDDARASRWSKPRAFEAGGSGLVSTVDDFHAFYRMLLNKGRVTSAGMGHERVLSRAAVELMMSDQLTSQQKAGTELFFGHGASWGMGGAVVTRRTDLYATPGRFGWDGGYGTSAHVDPAEDVVGVLLTQRMMESPQPPRVFRDFWTSAYQAIDD